MENYFKHKMRGKSPAVIAGMIIFGIIAITGLAILLGFVLMWLWNGLMPELFGLPFISYWQAVGLFILAKILLGGCGGRSSSGHHKKHHADTCEKEEKKKMDFSKWEHYDKFWEERGEQAYAEYVAELGQKEEPSTSPESKPSENDKTE